MINKEHHAILQEAYYKNQYPSQDKLFELVKSQGVSVTETRKFLKDQLVYQLHFKPKPEKRTERNGSGKIIAGFKDETWMADLVDMQDLGSRNRGYNWILTVVDVFSKKGYAIPLKNKTGPEVLAAFKDLFKDTKPQFLKTDNGSEFINKELASLFEGKNIAHILNQAGNHKEMGNIEKFNQTLLNMLFKSFTDTNKMNWIDIIEDTIAAYNNTFNIAIKGKPNEYDERKIAKLNAIRMTNTDTDSIQPTSIKNKFKKGDQVRIRLDKGAFGRGYTQSWTMDLYTIDSITKGGLYVINGKKHSDLDLQKVEKVESNPFKSSNSKIPVPVIAQPTIRKVLITEKRLKQVDKEIGLGNAMPNIRRDDRMQEVATKKAAEVPNALSFIRNIAANPMKLLNMPKRPLIQQTKMTQKVLAPLLAQRKPITFMAPAPMLGNTAVNVKVKVPVSDDEKKRKKQERELKKLR